MLRALLINGASAYLRHQKRREVSDPWLRELLARRPYKVVMVALAAKTARILWPCCQENHTATARSRRLLPDEGTAAAIALILRKAIRDGKGQEPANIPTHALKPKRPAPHAHTTH